MDFVIGYGPDYCDIYGVVDVYTSLFGDEFLDESS